jgi:MoxR-like ATPase
LSKAIGVQFSRIQFTPDLLPSDLLGTRVFDPAKVDFVTRKGPIFANLVLADEINRAPAKVQSALLEAMAECQVTIGEEKFVLDAPFVVMATQNPLEQEGTYSLPEAQLDRFLLKTVITYPTPEEEIQIMQQMGKSDLPTI